MFFSPRARRRLLPAPGLPAARGPRPSARLPAPSAASPPLAAPRALAPGARSKCSRSPGGRPHSIRLESSGREGVAADPPARPGCLRELWPARPRQDACVPVSRRTLLPWFPQVLEARSERNPVEERCRPSWPSQLGAHVSSRLQKVFSLCQGCENNGKRWLALTGGLCAPTWCRFGGDFFHLCELSPYIPWGGSRQFVLGLWDPWCPLPAPVTQGPVVTPEGHRLTSGPWSRASVPRDASGSTTAKSEDRF